MRVCRPGDYCPGANDACGGHEVILILGFAGILTKKEHHDEKKNESVGIKPIRVYARDES
jgi:hypothetical protein